MTINLVEFKRDLTPEKNQILYDTVMNIDPQNIQDADAIEKAAAIIDRSLLSPSEVMILETKVTSLKHHSITSRTLISSYIEKFGIIIYQFNPYFIDQFFSDVNSGEIQLDLPAFLFLDEKNKSIFVNDLKMEYCEFFQSDVAEKNEILVEHFFDFYCQMVSRDEPFINPYLRVKLTDEFIDEFCRRFELDRGDLEKIWQYDLSAVYNKCWWKNYREISSGRNRLENPAQDRADMISAQDRAAMITAQDHADMREAHDLAIPVWVDAREEKGIQTLKKRWKEEFEEYKGIGSVEAKSKSVVGRFFSKLFKKNK